VKPRLTKLLAVALLAACVAAEATEPRPPGVAPAFKAGVFDPAMAAPEFKLPGSDGQEVSVGRFRGKVVLLAFGFTSCAEVCPITLATLAGAKRKLGSEAKDLQVVYVTVDPERDDAARMKKYLGTFDTSFVGAVGDAKALAAVRERYGVMAEKHKYADGNYSIGHSSSVFMIDRAGKLQALMPYGHSSEDFVHDLQIMLRK
jgi:protein SCO1/2